jgi:hypothetical protein
MERGGVILEQRIATVSFNMNHFHTMSLLNFNLMRSDN